jgi:hypothetical protein
MKLKLILTAAIIGTVLALPSVSGAAAPPPPPSPQDSVTLSGGPATVATALQSFIIFDLNATSGPSGENPTGHVKVDALVTFPDTFTLHLEGPVTCLAVNGNQASINFIDPDIPALGVLRIQVVDNQPDTFDSFPVAVAASDCSPISRSPGANGPLMNGDITVVDAQPLPTARAQCMNGGWRQFGFKNEGLCIAFVNQGP